MFTYRNLMTVCAAAVLAFGLAACGSSDDDTAEAPAVEMPEPVPEPMPTDLDDTQAAAAAAAAAAMTASDNAAASAGSAAEATATLATLQTGADSNAAGTGGNEAAYAAHAAAGEAADAAAAAATASAAAAAATTGDAGEAAWRMAVAAQEAAEAAAETAATMSEVAIAAAMTELHVDGFVKSLGESSVDAETGMLTSSAGVITGWLDDDPERDIAAVDGEHFVQGSGPTGKTDEEPHVQAVEAGKITLGKKLDTSDDMARLAIFTHREIEKTVRVFTNHDDDEAVENLLTNTEVTVGTGGTAANVGALADGATAKSIGLYYLAEDGDDAAYTAAGGPAAPPPTVVTPATYPSGNWGEGHLDAYDVLQLMDEGGKPVKGVEIFEISVTDDTTDPPTTITRYARVEHTQTGQPGDETYYQLVDITADQSLTDDGDADLLPENLSVTVPIPIAEAYSHIHFGVWAGLIDETAGGDNSKLAELGIGFVQNFSASGVTPGNIVGTASYSGDWVANVRRKFAETAEKGAITLQDGHATLTANFSTDEFTGDLEGLAMLKGSLSGNSFSGTSATGITNPDLEATGKFDGEFSGNLYGPNGEEAAGVFAFDGDEAGAFTGAFGGRDDDQ